MNLKYTLRGRGASWLWPVQRDRLCVFTGVCAHFWALGTFDGSQGAGADLGLTGGVL